MVHVFLQALRQRFVASPWPALAIVLACALGLGWLANDVSKPWIVELDMATDTSTEAQLFAGTPNGYDEALSTRFVLAPGGSRQRYRIEIPAPATPARIRLDPGVSRGTVHLYSITLAPPGARPRTLAGAALAQRLRPLNDIRLGRADSGHPIEFVATGIDPHLEVAFGGTSSEALWPKLRILVVATLVAVLLATAWWGWRQWQGALLAGARRRRRLLAILAAPAVLAVLWLLDVGCATPACSSRGWRYGAGLLLAAASLAAVGAAVLQLLDRRRGPHPAAGLFLSLLVGQVAIVVYVYVRSLLHLLTPHLPITRWELLAIVAAALVVLDLPRRRQRLSFWTTARAVAPWRLVELACLAAICVVVADRELPRLVMLSSDPDTHAFFARQVERIGAIYRDQRDWGSEGLGYPAGSPALIFAWSRYAWLDVSNTLAALPLLQAFFAALALGELVAVRTRHLGVRTCVLLLALAVTASAFLFPLYQRFAHMEGVGRQLSIGCVALVFAILIWWRAPAHRPMATVLLAATLFVLATLNPVNVVMPCLLVAALALATTVRERRAPWALLLAPLACPILLLMDPFYFQLLTGQAQANKLTMDANLVVMSLEEIRNAWFAALRHHFADFMRQQFQLLPDHAFPAFLLLAGGFGIAVVTAMPASRTARGTWLGIAALAAMVIAASALMQSVSADSRLYLLAYYFQFSLAQYRALLVTLLAASLLLAAHRRNLGPGRVVLLAVLCTGLSFVAMRAVQPMVLAPRHDYCGAFGCARPSDVTVVRKLEAMVRSGAIARDDDGQMPRVLVPNLQARSGPEAWVFPTGGSRLLAVADALPVAFYYYQGDPDFTTRNYVEHVCSRLDRRWLMGERIHYVFLPADRDGVCLASMESLPATDEVVLREGNSILIRLRVPGTR